MNLENILDKTLWKRYSLDLNTGTDAEYFKFAIQETVIECQKICKSVEDTFEVNPRLKPLVVNIVKSCIENMDSK